MMSILPLLRRAIPLALFACVLQSAITFAAPAGWTTLVNFNGTNGKDPNCLVQGRNGDFYGTTIEVDGTASGSVFRMTPDGVLTTLVDFNNFYGCSGPTSLVQASNGNFYGTATFGGAYYCGSVFLMTPNGNLERYHDFNRLDDGAEPYGLIQGSDGNLYGFTTLGGNGNGTAFRMTPAGEFTTLASFNPTYQFRAKSLVPGIDGNLYGLFERGQVGTSSYGGMVFRMTPAGVLTTLVNFHGTNGESPNSLIQGSDGNFYGTTERGGSDDVGTVFRMTPAGALTTLVNFSFLGTGGYQPNTALVEDNDGNFYGTTEYGGNSISGFGTVFRMTPAGVLTYLLDLNERSLNAISMIKGKDGNLYGTYDNNADQSLPEKDKIFRIGLAPSITVTQSGVLKNGVSSRSYGKVTLASSRSKTFTIKNTSFADITGLAVSKNGLNKANFKVQELGAKSLIPGASTTFTVTFKPTATGIRNAAIHIKSNDANKNPFDIKLSGTGLAASQ